MSRQTEWIIITSILLLAAVLRLWALGDVPPGLSHDEVANGLIASDILAGNRAIYFTAAYGHEPLYQYIQAATVALFGEQWLGLRYPSVALGLLGWVAVYVLVRRLFGVSTALLTGGWLAVSFWPLFYARVALRVISLPLIAALAAYFLFRAAGLPARDPPNSRGKLLDSVLAGIFLGLSLYTYMAARILPFIFAALFIYLLLAARSFPPFSWASLWTFFITAAIVSAPLLIWLAIHPGAEYRISEVREPLDKLLAGDPSLVLANLAANVKSFTCTGDSWPHQNIPGRPVFADPISAILFYAGLIVALWRWRVPRYGFLLVWLAMSLAPSIITSAAPSSVRDILAVVVIFVFPALALVEAGHWFKQRVQLARFRRALPLVSSLLLVPCFFLATRDYFIRWPTNDAVRFFYQTDMTAVAHKLDQLPPDTPLVVAGLSVHSMDGPTLDMSTRRDVHRVRLCDARETLVVPAARDAWLFVPRIVPFDADLEERLLEWGATASSSPGESGGTGSFVAYRLPNDATLRRKLRCLESAAALPNDAPVTLPVSFDGQLAFLGYELLPPPGGETIKEGLAPGDTLTMLTYWRVKEPPATPLKIFVHLSKSGVLVAQHDGLGSPPHGWMTGDLIVQKHTIQISADIVSGQYDIEIGVYDAATNVRLPVLAANRLFLYPIMIVE